MILYKCDRCGKIQKKPFKNIIKIITEKTYGEYFAQNRMFCNDKDLRKFGIRKFMERR